MQPNPQGGNDNKGVSDIVKKATSNSYLFKLRNNNTLIVCTLRLSTYLAESQQLTKFMKEHWTYVYDSIGPWLYSTMTSHYVPYVSHYDSMGLWRPIRPTPVYDSIGLWRPIMYFMCPILTFSVQVDWQEIKFWVVILSWSWCIHLGVVVIIRKEYRVTYSIYVFELPNSSPTVFKTKHDSTWGKNKGFSSIVLFEKKVKGIKDNEILSTVNLSYIFLILSFLIIFSSLRFSFIFIQSEKKAKRKAQLSIIQQRKIIDYWELPKIMVNLVLSCLRENIRFDNNFVIHSPSVTLNRWAYFVWCLLFMNRHVSI